MAGGRHQDRDEANNRRFLYVDVEELIRYGFLCASVEIGGITLVIRSLSRTELGMVSHRTTTEQQWRRWCLSTAVFSIDGWELGEVPNAAAAMYHNWLKDFDKHYVNSLMHTFLGLQRRVNRSHERLEAYCYEHYSRYAWFTKVNEAAVVRNELQDSWIAFNEQCDQREVFSHNWDRTASVVAATSQKGGKAVRRHLDEIRQKQEQREVRSIEEMVNFVISGSSEDPGATIMVRGQPVRLDRIKQATTVAEMEAEMELVMSGQKDGHDIQVLDYEQAIRDAVKKRQAASRARQDQRAAMDDLMHQAGIGGGTKLVGYSPQQLGDLGPTKPAGVKTTPTASSAHRLYQRYLEKEVGVGHIGTQGVPEAAGGKTLQEEIKGRTPTFRSEAIDGDSVRKPNANK